MSVYDISGSALSAYKEWTEVSANNIANMNTTNTREGGPYHRQAVVFGGREKFENLLGGNIGNGVEVKEIVTDKAENVVYQPDHPDANEEGMVRMPAINMAAEMTNMLMASKGYNANISTLNEAKKLNEKTYEIGKA